MAAAIHLSFSLSYFSCRSRSLSAGHCNLQKAAGAAEGAEAHDLWGVGGETFGAGVQNVTRVRPVRRDQRELDPTESDTGRGSLLLSSSCDRSGYYWAAHGAGLIPTETQFPCRTLAACLVGWRLAAQCCQKEGTAGDCHSSLSSFSSSCLPLQQAIQCRTTAPSHTNPPQKSAFVPRALERHRYPTGPLRSITATLTRRPVVRKPLPPTGRSRWSGRALGQKPRAQKAIAHRRP